MSKGPITLVELRDMLTQLIDEHPEWADLPLIFAKDDEGSGYHKVWNEPVGVQVEDLTDYYLEVVGFQGSVDDKNINCVIIN